MKTTDVEMSLALQRVRTLAIVRRLAQGGILPLSGGQVIGMGEDMTMGYILEDGVTPLSEMSLRVLNVILNQEGIGFPVPVIDR